MPLDDDDLRGLDVLFGNVLAYGALLVVGAFLICVPIFFPLGFIFGAIDWALFGGAVLAAAAVAWRLRRYFVVAR